MKYDVQKAGMLRRIPAWLLDMILLITLATGLIAGMSYILDMDTQVDKMDAIYKQYEKEYGVSFTITGEEYEKLSEAEKAKYEQANVALAEDTQAQKAYELLMNLTLITLSVGILGAFLILEFAVPLLLKNGQTLGKKAFGVALMRNDGIKVTTFMMFARSILGKYTVETMMPVLLLVSMFFNGGSGFSVMLLVAFLLAQIIIPLATRNKTAIHDLMACTIAVELSSQMIFDTVQEQEEYYKRLDEENAASADE